MSVEIKEKIKKSLISFSQGNLTQNSLNLFITLRYNTERQSSLSTPTYDEFKLQYLEGFNRFNEEKALVKKWKYIDLLFQLSKEEMTAQHSLFDTKRIDNKDYQSYLFFVIELDGDYFTRTALSQITREVNKPFPMPVMILFKYENSITLSIINRRLHKRDEHKDVLEKVTLIKDISIENPHRAHLEILFDLSFNELLRIHKFSNFVELHNAWQKTLDTKELNKRFYRELSNWYFWAMEYVFFPDDAEKDIKIRNATNLIRLITRIIFIWFIKEKHLVTEKIFDQKEASNIVKDFQKNKKSHNYYLAILQNLFFGTLNQKMGERKFTKNGGINTNKKEYGVKTLFRYADLFTISEKEALAIFKDVPFLNGGLFDCLDKEDDTGKVIYVDGFSRNASKQAVVPDFLFFGDEQVVDLSEVYGDKKRRKEKVKGLFHILSSYKFTITENTPIEEEIALDPELLGRVFENLLASYNPETQTTARKQTGSFYTPREIVNYMVDESLKAYLKHALLSELPGYVEIGRDQTNMFGNVAKKGQLSLQEKLDPSPWHHKEKELEQKLNELFGYTETQPFTDEESISRIIKAIDNAKILDPACGSGAFPMGVLHKMVYILEKIDPDNKRWREVQKKKALKETEEAYKIGDKETRQLRLLDIDDAFENNASGFGRKLYLIENCIFGIDIQPIAIQICKLRFFISLIVDQTVNRDKENFGIRSLPNLETKFVAADTLIGLPAQMILRNVEIDALETTLKNIRHDYFSAKTRKEKLACQKKDKQLRTEIASLLEQSGWDHETTSQVSQFDPYDQNKFAPFFDFEWMFGLKPADGSRGVFDIVIGNPPYIQIQKFSGMQQQKEWEKQKYETYAKTGDVYCLFYERGYQLLRTGGVLTYISSNKWMRANYGKTIRKYFTLNGTVLQLVDFGDSPIFENATTYTNILIWKKSKKKIKTKAWDLSKAYESNITMVELLKSQGECEPLFCEDSFVIVKREQTVIKNRIEKIGVPLKDWDISIYRGVLTGFNEAFIVDGKKKNELITDFRRALSVI